MRTTLTIIGLLLSSLLYSQQLDVDGDVIVNGKISNVTDPTSAQDAATKGYVDNMLLSFGVSMGSAGIQHLLNAGYCPLDIINAGASKDSLYGKIYQGGLIFYLDDLDTIAGIKGFVCAPVDQSSAAEWGCFGTDLLSVPNVLVFPPSGLGAEIGDGITNTAAILNDCPMAPAALACTGYMGGGFMDWFLPSAKELDLMWENLADSDGGGTNSGPGDPGNLGGFASGYYWSSTERDGSYTWVQVFNDGFQFGDVKYEYRKEYKVALRSSEIGSEAICS